MFSSGSGNTVIKSKLISRRMFLLTTAKAVVLVGVLGRLISLQINETKKYKTKVVISWGKSRNLDPDTRKIRTGEPKTKRLKKNKLSLFLIILEK